MKTVFDKSTRDELIGRINLLNESSTAQWGKMKGGYLFTQHFSILLIARIKDA